MKKYFLPVVIITALISSVSLPYHGHALSAVEKINRQLDQLQQKQSAANKEAQSTKSQIQDIQQSKQKAQASVADLRQQINKASQRLTQLMKQIDQTTDRLQEAGIKLGAAEKRVEERDKLLKSRVRLMYTNGFVSYLEVLLSSTSFSDFLDRYDALSSIVGQDKRILAENKKDRNSIADNKKKIEQNLTQVKGFYAEADKLRDSLQIKEKNQEVLIASLDQKQGDLEENNEEQEKQMIAYAREKANLLAKKKMLITPPKTNQGIANTGGGKLGIPIDGSYRLSSGFGYRTDPTGGGGEFHKGLDFAAPKGTTIVAAEDGTVILAQWWSGYGNCVIIDHGHGMWTLYGHIRNGGIFVKPNEQVKRGQKIAEVGSTGDSTGNHCHFEVRINEKPVNPVNYLNL